MKKRYTLPLLLLLCLLAGFAMAQSNDLPGDSLLNGQLAVSQQQAFSLEPEIKGEEQKEKKPILSLEGQLLEKQKVIESMEKTIAEQQAIISKDTPLIYEQARTIESQDRQLKEQKRKITLGTLAGSLIVLFLIAMQ